MITAHVTYLGFYHAHKTDTIPLKDKHVYKITRIEGSFAIPVGWSTEMIIKRVGECITEDELQHAQNKRVGFIVT